MLISEPPNPTDYVYQTNLEILVRKCSSQLLYQLRKVLTKAKHVCILILFDRIVFLHWYAYFILTYMVFEHVCYIKNEMTLTDFIPHLFYSLQVPEVIESRWLNQAWAFCTTSTSPLWNVPIGKLFTLSFFSSAIPIVIVNRLLREFVSASTDQMYAVQKQLYSYQGVLINLFIFFVLLTFLS